MKRAALLFAVVIVAGGLSAAEDKTFSPGPSNVGSFVEAAGGPDDYGYIFADNSEAACSTLYNYVDITATGTGAGLTGSDDSYAGPFPMGFSFDFYGTPHTEFYVGTNGVVYFEDEYLGLANTCPLPDTQSYTPQVFIGPYHDDLYVQDNGEIFYETFASCPVGDGGMCTIIQFTMMMDCCGADDDMEFEVVLYDDGSIVYLYEQPANDDTSQTNGASATVGIQGDPAAVPAWGIGYSCNTESLSSGLAVAFAPPTAITSGSPNVCGAQATPTPAGPQPVPTSSRTGLIVFMTLVVIAAFVLISRRSA